MGLVTRSFESENDLTIFTISGAVDAEQLANQIISFLKGEPTQLVLWDITVGSLAAIPAKDLRTIVDLAAPFAHKRKGGRTAILCTTDLNFGLSRMFQSFAELMQIPFEIRVFRDLDEAKGWLYELRKR